LHPFLALGRKRPLPLRTIIGIPAAEAHLDLVDIPPTSIVKYCDPRETLGLGCLLLNATVGAIFPDGSHLIMDPYQESLQYWTGPAAARPENMNLTFTVAQKKVATFLS
jgi:hypothetical protein